MLLRFAGVSMMDGMMQFTLMFLPRNSSAMLSVKRETALLDAIYAPICPTPFCEEADDTLMILPPPCFSMTGTVAAAVLAMERVLRLNIKFQVASDVSCTASPMTKPPAIFARTSMRPNRLMILANASLVDSLLVRSQARRSTRL